MSAAAVEPAAPTVSAAKARELHTEIVRGCQAIRRAWVYVAGRLFQMRESEGWRQLGFRTWDAYLASDDVGISPEHGDRLLRAWRVLVIDSGLDPGQLERTHLSKLAYVLPAVTDGRLTASQAIVEARSRPQEELRNLYVQRPRGASKEKRCPNCGAVLS